jgi:predicted enzyme related to lactoylglutathione lyase
MKIKVMTIHVDDQAKALRFYCEVLGFTKKVDFSNHGYRWLTVASAEAPDGPELQLEANTDPAARSYQQARFQKGQPAAMFFVDDVQAEYNRLVGLGVKFTTPPSKVTGSTIAMLDDTCGNLVQLTALDRR